MKRVKPYIIYTILAVGLFIFFALWIFSENEKKAYEDYLSDVLMDKINQIVSAPSNNLLLFQEVVDSKKITKVLADELQRGFSLIAFNTQDVSHMAVMFGRLKDYSDDTIVAINSEYQRFFLKLPLEQGEVYLNVEQMAFIEKMKDLMYEYEQVVKAVSLKHTNKETFKGQTNDYYDEFEIDDDYWKSILIGFDEVTDMSYRLR
jgi:hypothetical protein